jgi:MFS family permease
VEEKKNSSYKWIVVGACFLMIFTCLGFGSSTKPLMLKPITESLGIERALFSINDSFRYITTSIVNIFFGALIVKFGPRKLIGFGFLALTASAICYAVATHVLVLYLGGILLGMGFSFTGTTMVGFVVNKWCKRNKGTIMGAVLAANGLGGALSAQIVSPIIESSYGYRAAYFLIAGIFLVIGTLVVLLVREPREGEEEQGEAVAKKKRGQNWIGVEEGVVLKKAYCWGALVCIFLFGLTLNGIAGISAAHMRDVGLDPTYVATVVSCHSLSLAGFKFLSGFLYDRFGLRVTVAISAITGVCVMLALSMVTNSTFGMVLAMIYGVFSSLALPLETVMLPIFASDLFGQRSYNKMLGIIVSVNTAGFAAGSLFMNICYDILGSYASALVVAACMMGGVAIAVQLVITAAYREKKRILHEAENTEQ